MSFTLNKKMDLSGLGILNAADGFVPLAATSDGWFGDGSDGGRCVAATGDRKVEFIGFSGHSLALVNSVMGCPA